MLQALLTALLSGLFSGFIMFGLNERRDRVERRLQKIEDAIEAYDRWQDDADAYVASYWGYGTLGDHQKAEAARSLISERMRLSERRAMTLIKIYLPDHSQAAAAVLKPLANFAPLGAKIITASLHKLPYDPERFTPISTAGYQLLEARVAAHRMYEAARAIVERPHLLTLPSWLTRYLPKGRGS